jgi:hypothetical protein
MSASRVPTLLEMEIPDCKKGERDRFTAGYHSNMLAGILTTVIMSVAETVDSERESRRRKCTRNLPCRHISLGKQNFMDAFAFYPATSD